MSNAMKSGSRQAQDGKSVSFGDFTSGLKDWDGVVKLLRQEYGTSRVKEIDRICNWLSASPKLAKELAKDISEGRLDIDWTRNAPVTKDYIEIAGGSYEKGNLFTLGVWLSQRYLCEEFSVSDPKYPKIRQPDENTSVFLSYNQEEHRIMLIPYVMDGGPAEAFLKGFTIGLHELGHGLRQTRDHEVCRLSEFAVALIMRELSPPIEQMKGRNVNTSFGKMSVDPLNVKALEGQGFYQDEDGGNLQNRYVAHYIMPWIEGWQDRTGKKLDLFDFKHTPAERDDVGKSIEQINKRLGGPFLRGNGISMTLKDIFAIYGELMWKHDKDDGFVAEHFCKSEGILDPELAGKMREVFKELAKEDKPFDLGEFVSKLESALTKVFGEPKRHEYPPGYGQAPRKEGGFFRA